MDQQIINVAFLIGKSASCTNKSYLDWCEAWLSGKRKQSQARLTFKCKADEDEFWALPENENAAIAYRAACALSEDLSR